MAPEEWPIAAPPVGNGAQPAHCAGARRLSTVVADFFLDPDQRLSEQERALMTSMLAALLGNIAEEIRAALPPGCAEANDSDGHQLLRKLASANLLKDDRLVLTLLRRADEERIGSALRARSSGQSSLLQGLIANSDEEIAARAMALILARGRRRDRLGQPRVEYDDLPANVARDLAYAVAAAVGQGGVQGDRDTALHEHAGSAASALIARHDGSKALDQVTDQLVEALLRGGLLEEGLLSRAFEEGDIALFAAALARQAGIGAAHGREYLLGGAPGKFVLLLRMAGASRDLAARLLASLGDLIHIHDPVSEMNRFEQLEDAHVAAARDWLRLEPSYRAAVTALDCPRG